MIVHPGSRSSLCENSRISVCVTQAWIFITTENQPNGIREEPRMSDHHRSGWPNQLVNRSRCFRQRREERRFSSKRSSLDFTPSPWTLSPTAFWKWSSGDAKTLIQEQRRNIPQSAVHRPRAIHILFEINWLSACWFWPLARLLLGLNVSRVLTLTKLLWPFEHYSWSLYFWLLAM